MQKINYTRGQITKAKGEVAKWTHIEGDHRTNLREAQANGAAKMVEKAIKKLEEVRKKFADLQFPDSNMIEKVNRCKECGSRIAERNEYCGECMCENDSF